MIFVHFFVILTLGMFFVVQGDENPGFFLKITKNVPRIGRRSLPTTSEVDNFFFKGLKNVPRMGRRNDLMAEEKSPEDDDSMRIQKRGQPPASSGNYNNVQPFDLRLLFDILADDYTDLKFVSWRDFDEALEADTVLFEKLSQVAKEKGSPEWKTHMRANNFVSLLPGNGNRHSIDDLLYRHDRPMGGYGQSNYLDARKGELNKEFF
uniref:Putative ecdysis triggering hormone n=1 Tax=Lutzomyia longipalpis TaxID=7200 RepID=A0A1B0CW38_LUTLO